MRALIGGPSRGVPDFDDGDDSGDDSGVEAVFVGLPQQPIIMGIHDDDDEDDSDNSGNSDDDEVESPPHPQPVAPNHNEDSDDSIDDVGVDTLPLLDDDDEVSSNFAEAGSILSDDDSSPPTNLYVSQLLRNRRLRAQSIQNQNLGESSRAIIPNGISNRNNPINVFAAFAEIPDDEPLRILTVQEAEAEREEAACPVIVIQRPSSDENETEASEGNEETPTEVQDSTSPSLGFSNEPTPESIRQPDQKESDCATEEEEDGHLKLPDYVSQPSSQHEPGKRKFKKREGDSDSDSDDEEKKSKSTKYWNKSPSRNSFLSSPFFGGLRRNKPDESPSVRSESSPFYSNPMESDLDCENDDAFRGDRIGNTTYSERNVIQILMKWMKVLEATTQINESNELDLAEKKEAVDVLSVLDSAVDEDLSLLWDLSSEADVVSYLIDKDVYMIIKDTLVGSNCGRLKEIALGIFANMLSTRNCLDSFSKYDDQLQLIETVITEIQTSADPSILIQAFSILERVIWHNSEVKPNISWIVLILNLEFVNVVNFLLESSMNVLLLGKIVLTLQFLFQTLSRTDVFDSSETNEPDETQLDIMMTQNYDVFCETSFVSSLCEGLNELLKCSFDNEADMDDIKLPPGHVQVSLCSGLSCLCYLQSFKAGQTELKTHNLLITAFLKEFFRKFHLYTERIDIHKTFDYFTSGLSLMSFCHREFPELERSAVIKPVQAASRLTTRDELKDGEGQELDLRNSIGVVVQEHLAEIGDKFGLTSVYDCINEDKNLSIFLKFVNEAAENFAQKEKGEEESVVENGFVDTT